MKINIKKLKELLDKDLEFALRIDDRRKRLDEIEAEIKVLSEEATMLNEEENSRRFAQPVSTEYILDLLHAEIKRAKKDGR